MQKQYFDHPQTKLQKCFYACLSFWSQGDPPSPEGRPFPGNGQLVGSTHPT